VSDRDDEELDELGEEELSEGELREAAALVRALERGTAEEPPEEALEAAALLRYAQSGGDLEEARSEALLEEIMGEARWPEPREEEPAEGLPLFGRLLRWLSLGAALTAAVALAWVATGGLPSASGPASPAALPAPSAALISAQAAAFSGGEEERERFASQMSGYRGELYAALSNHY
jgi:hypothetical protein